MNYVLEMLNRQLSEELRALHSASEMTKGQGFSMPNRTLQAYMESERLARERIPQLEKAIALLSGEEQKGENNGG